MEIRTSSFPYGGPQFPHLSYRANISNHCELHRPSASELLGLKSIDSWAPDLDTSRTSALSAVSTVGNFVPHYSSKTLVEKSLGVIPTKAILGFLDVHILEVPKEKTEIRSPERKAASPHWENHVRQGSSPGQFSKAKQNQPAIKAFHGNSREASCMRTQIPLWIGPSEARTAGVKHKISQHWFNGL